MEEIVRRTREYVLTHTRVGGFHGIEHWDQACRLHTSALRTGNPTIDACFDADRLDLGRVGVTPDPDRMATEKGKELAKHLPI